MAQATRQNELLAAEVWETIYQSFSSINFASYDFNTIRTSMVNYIRANYPEDYNDWIESSEFIFILDLLAYLGEQLAFRFDLNVRENFMDTAERKDSILRLARMLSYSPKRNYPASGLLKIEQITTTESLVDSNDRDLSNRVISWNDPANADWFEQWVIVMNAIFTNTNPFGRPVNQGTILGIQTELYTMNNMPFTIPTMSFSADIDGTGMNFEIVNPNFTDGEYFYEVPPNPVNSFGLLYQNDSLGNNSNNTGFFFYFKEGNLQKEDYYLQNPTENRVLDINTTGINEPDVWFHEITDNGLFIQEWKNVPTLFGENIIYNSIAATVRNIYTVTTREDEQISLRFADGRYGSIPQGFYRLWYRTSNGLVYRIKAQDIQRQEVSMRYYNSRNELNTVTFTFSLKDTVSNSQPAETTEEIRVRAPRVYYTQNRMVSGEDYNLFPQRSNVAVKVKAVNRTYSGHSRYIDINDPTGTYQNTNVFSNDGIIYKAREDTYKNISRSTNLTPTQIVIDELQPLLVTTEMKNFLFEQLASQFILTANNTPNMPGTPNAIFWVPITWTASDSTIYNHTGIFSTSVSQGTGGNNADYITEGAMIKFASAGWVKVESIVNYGNEFPNNDRTVAGEVVLSAIVKTGDTVLQIKPAFDTTLVQVEISSFETYIRNSNTFAIRYDIPTKTWKAIDGNHINLTNDFNLSTAGDVLNQNNDSSWLVYVEYSPDSWNITARGMIYVFESVKDTRFFYVNNYKVTDLTTGLAKRDYIKIVSTNKRPTSNPMVWQSNTVYQQGEFVLYNGKTWRATVANTALNTIPQTGSTSWVEVPVSSFGEDLYFKVYDSFIYNDGHVETRRVKIDFYDSQDDGLPDDPESFEKIVMNDFFNGDVQLSERFRYAFWETYTETDGYLYKRPNLNVRQLPNLESGNIYYYSTAATNKITSITSYANISTPTLTGAAIGDLYMIYFDIDDNNSALIWRYSGTAWVPLTGTTVDEDVVYANGLFFIRTFDGSKAVPNYFEQVDNVYGNVVFDWKNKKFWKCDPITNPLLPWTQAADGAYEYNVGRVNLDYQWKHYAPRDQRIDPAITNIIDLYVLTTEYNRSLRNWIATGTLTTDKPLPPTINELQSSFTEFEDFKMVSDQLIWKPVRYKLLFGNAADDNLKAIIKVVKTNSTTMSDGEIKSAVITAINNYFSLVNWDFGETFYFTDMAAYIHQQMATIIGSIVLVPLNAEAKFGNLFQIKCESDELFISCADVTNVTIETNFNNSTLRIGK
jgi:hypothetical protein